MFNARKVAPSTTDKHWIHRTKGGLNECILISGNSCLPNCVGYAWGRAYEILGTRPKLSLANAEDWFGFNDGYARSKEPSLGSIICWAKGRVGYGGDGAGHVAVVEEIKSNGDIVTSNSGYNSSRFWTQSLTKASGYAMTGYTFQGFIHILNSVPSTSPMVQQSAQAQSLDKSLSGTYVVDAESGLHLRRIPGILTSDNSIIVLPKGTLVKNFGYYSIIDDVKWLYVQAEYQGSVYTGFCSIEYLKK